jgi:hypothetical protein
MRPAINCRNSTDYITANLLRSTLRSCIPIPISFNVKNASTLTEGLKEMPVDENIRLASLESMVLFVG